MGATAGCSTPATAFSRIWLVFSSLRLVLHSACAWISVKVTLFSVIIARLFKRHPLGWPVDLEIISEGFKASLDCIQRGRLEDFRPLLLAFSYLQFYPALDITPVDAGGCRAYWISLKTGRRRQNKDADLVMYYVHGGAFVAGDALMSARSFQHWMQRLAGCGIHAKVLSLQYPLAPEHPFPAAVVAAAATYSWLSEQLKGSSTRIIGVGDSAGANILVAALAALRDIASTGGNSSSKASALQTVAAAAAAVNLAPAGDAVVPTAANTVADADAVMQLDLQDCSTEEDIKVAQAMTAELFARLASKLSLIHSCTGSDSSNDTTCTAGSSVGASAASGRGSGSVTAAKGGAGFQPPAGVVLVSPAMDTSDGACFHDQAWLASHEARFDYLPHNLVAGGMCHYVTHPALLSLGYVSPMYLASFEGLVGGGGWLVLSGGAELLAQDIHRFASHLCSSIGSSRVQQHCEPHMPHSWAIIPTPSMYPRQQVVVDYIARAATS